MRETSAWMELRRFNLRPGLVALSGILTLLTGSMVPTAGARDDLLEGPFVQEGVGESIDQHLETLEGMGFSGVALVMKDGLIVLHQAYGMDRGGGDSVEVRDLFAAGPFERILARAALGALAGRNQESVDPASLRTEIERLAGLPYEEALRRLVLERAGMRRARFVTTTPRAEDQAPMVGGTGPSGTLRRLGGSSLGGPLLRLFGSGLRKSARSLRDVPPAPGLTLTASDLYRWELALRRDDLFPEDAAAWAAANTAGTWKSSGYEIAILREPDDQLFACILVNSDMGWGEAALAAVGQGAHGGTSQGNVFLLLMAAIAVIFLSIGTASQVRRRTRRKRRSPIPF